MQEKIIDQGYALIDIYGGILRNAIAKVTNYLYFLDVEIQVLILGTFKVSFPPYAQSCKAKPEY